MKVSSWLVFIVANVAQAVTPFELPWMNHSSGQKTVYKSADAKNAVLVIEAYFNACNPCNINAPQVDDLADDYASETRVHVLDVGFDSGDGQYASWIAKHKPNHPVLKDAMGQVLLKAQLGTVGFPSTYVVDCKGNVVAKTKGVWDPAKRQQLDLGIETALKTVCVAEEPVEDPEQGPKPE